MSNKKHDLILKALLLSATHLQLLNSADFGGSEEEVELSNTCYELLCDIVGFDIAEDKSWGCYTIRATDEEITKYGIEQLISRYPEVCPTGTPQYVLADHEWQRRLVVEQSKTARLVALVGIFGTLLGAITGHLLTKW